MLHRINTKHKVGNWLLQIVLGTNNRSLPSELFLMSEARGPRGLIDPELADWFCFLAVSWLDVGGRHCSMN